MLRKKAKRNKYIPIAYDALATISQYTGDFDKAVEYKIMSLNATKFELAEYIDYFNVLKTGYEYYTKTENNRKVEARIPELIGRHTKVQIDVTAYGFECACCCKPRYCCCILRHCNGRRSGWLCCMLHLYVLGQ